MLDYIFSREYKKSPSLKWDLGWLFFWILLLSALILAGATSGFSTSPDIEFITERMSPILSLFGSVCLAYGLLTGIRNESNKNRLNQDLIRLMEHRDAANSSIPVEATRKKRVDELSCEIQRLSGDLEHEMEHGRREIVIGWFGLILLVVSSMLQIFSVPVA